MLLSLQTQRGKILKDCLFGFKKQDISISKKLQSKFENIDERLTLYSQYNPIVNFKIDYF